MSWDGDLIKTNECSRVWHGINREQRSIHTTKVWLSLKSMKKRIQGVSIQKAFKVILLLL